VKEAAVTEKMRNGYLGIAISAMGLPPVTSAVLLIAK
jgi:F420-0:gamma-glutamyl ligase